MDDVTKIEFMEKSLQKLMGDVIDNARMSEMSERAFKQFERTTKSKVNIVIRLFKEQLFDITEDYSTNDYKRSG